MAPRAWCDGTKSAEWLRDGTMRRIKGNEHTQTTNQILQILPTWMLQRAGGVV